ncbi:MAG TPA: c-type cytochrome [Anaeromyxobacteraceae bacterium]|nr:c-type cytochrome [Anaeromyxobacteraceae bacterium]
MVSERLAAPVLGAVPGYMPARASSVAEGVDQVFAFIFWLSAFFLALIVVLTVVFVVRYRKRPSRLEPEPSPSHDLRLELLWSGIPLALVFVLFGVSTKTYSRMTTLDPGAAPLRIQVTARKWSWWFDHPGGKGAGELHLVVGRPTELVMASADVIHSLYVPDFRLKQDVVPGRFTRMTFTPVLPGTFPVVCAEFCGTDHSRMSAMATVHPDQASFDAWAREGVAPAASLVDLGKKVFLSKGCVGCHSTDGSPRVGPTLKNLWGRSEKFADGTEALVDESYVRESVLRPAARITAGFANVMPPVPLDEREIQGLCAYLQALKDGP